ncbi:type I restriction endonuclease subunit R [Pontibacter burrus]|uniref:Type I restriction enzyme endonuclease subunit n=1 Tax=Pontibacter burrus TaxID=2704466 RepID=A0A6B3LMR4_9BACT|nr:HsdR family type I site-specific deoxyribonuclease [Pontibacter burrus]NEM97183.1 type I restriction endonuclease subunit R [Pontibacter burrus]
MTEHTLVEQPFLKQLENLGWQVYEQSAGIPTDATLSLRTNFKEVVLPSVLKQALQSINLDENRQPWLSEKQVDELYNEISDFGRMHLLEANKSFTHTLLNNSLRADYHDDPADPRPVKLIDFDHPERNSFIAINQFKVDTPGLAKACIIPDVVLFVNGLPLVVVECKNTNAYTTNPLHEALKQLQRYSNQRPSTHAAGLKEGEESLFWYNQICVATYGDKACYGTITSLNEQFFAEWKYIYPEAFQNYIKPLDVERSQERLVQGILPPHTLLDIVRSFTLFMPVGGGKEAKIVCRYQQYRAVGKIVERLKAGQTPMERSGVVWHTQGSGKSLTMVMLIKKLRTESKLADYKVLLVNDRTDLEDQLSDTATLTGEKIDFIESIKDVKPKLSTPTSNAVMVMMHKFQAKEYKLTGIAGEILSQAAEPLKQYNVFGEVNPSEKILILIDEAHRTQSSDLGNNLFEAFPNATKIAFTGTPLITERHKKKTHDRFGGYIDQYRLRDAVNDGATIPILYEGREPDNAINDKSGLDQKFEEAFGSKEQKEKELIKRKYAIGSDLREAEEHIAAVARDIVNHYTENILPNGFKAQVVTSSVLAAVRYKDALLKTLQEKVTALKAEATPDEELIKKLEFLQVYAVVSGQGTNEEAIITQARKEASAANAVDNFKKAFNYDVPETGIAFLVVCDMLLTGFDAPIEQVMYLDKKLKEHNLLQAIARVNRTYKGKTRGYVIDYATNTQNLQTALSIYGSDEVQEIMENLKGVETEIPVLESRYRRLVQLFEGKGVANFEKYLTQHIKDIPTLLKIQEQCIDLAADIKFRSSFDVYLKQLMESMDIVLPRPAASPYRIPAKQLGHLQILIRNRYKDDTINIEGAGEKIRQLINEHLVSLGINPKIPPVELLSKDFMKEAKKNSNLKAVASEMEHAIRKHIKVNVDDDPAFYTKLSERLEKLLQQHHDDWDAMVKALENLRNEAAAGRQEGIAGLSATEAPFYDLMMQTAFKSKAPSAEEEEKAKATLKEAVKQMRATIKFTSFWEKGSEIDLLKGDLSDILISSDVEALIEHENKIINDLLDLARRRHNELIHEEQQAPDPVQS